MKITEKVVTNEDGIPIRVDKEVDIIGGVVDLAAGICGFAGAAMLAPQIVKLVPTASHGIAKVGSKLAQFGLACTADYAIYRSITGTYETIREETTAVQTMISSRSDEILQEVVQQATVESKAQYKKK